MSWKPKQLSGVVTILATISLVATGLYRASLPAQSPVPAASVAGLGKFGAVLVSKTDHTLFIVVREGCRYCVASVPLYRRVIATRNEQNAVAKVRVVGLILEQSDQPAAEAYARQHNLPFDEVVALSRQQQRQLTISGTPTVLLATRTGAITQRWIGRLDETAQQRLLGELFPSTVPRPVVAQSGRRGQTL